MFIPMNGDQVYGLMMRADTSPRITRASDCFGRVVAWAVFWAAGVRS